MLKQTLIAAAVMLTGVAHAVELDGATDYGTFYRDTDPITEHNLYCIPGNTRVGIYASNIEDTSQSSLITTNRWTTSCPSANNAQDFWNTHQTTFHLATDLLDTWELTTYTRDDDRTETTPDGSSKYYQTRSCEITEVRGVRDVRNPSAESPCAITGGHDPELIRFERIDYADNVRVIAFPGQSRQYSFDTTEAYCVNNFNGDYTYTFTDGSVDNTRNITVNEQCRNSLQEFVDDDPRGGLVDYEVILEEDQADTPIWSDWSPLGQYTEKRTCSIDVNVREDAVAPQCQDTLGRSIGEGGEEVRPIALSYSTNIGSDHTGTWTPRINGRGNVIWEAILSDSDGYDDVLKYRPAQGNFRYEQNWYGTWGPRTLVFFSDGPWDNIIGSLEVTHD